MDKPEKIDSVEKFLDWYGREQWCDADLETLISEEHKKMMPDWWWHRREQKRRYDNNLQVPYWVAEAGIDSKYYVYITAADPLKIGYTPSPEYGRADRQIVTSVGKFLTKQGLSEHDIRHIVARHRSTYLDREVHFAFGADEIEHVYANGPGSCMSGKDWSHETPTRVYDGPDTALAFLKTGERITARCLCNINKSPMQWVRAYGDENMIINRLEGLGFVPGSPAGARLRRAPLPDKDHLLICPYVDNVGAATDDGEFLVLDNDGPIDCQSTAGFVNAGGGDIDDEHDHRCDWCGEGCDETREARNGYGDEIWICVDCAVNSDAFHLAIAYVDGHVLYTPYDAVIRIGGTWYLNEAELLQHFGYRYSNMYAEWYQENDVAYVESEDAYYPNDDVCFPKNHGDTIALKEDCTKGDDGDWILDDDVAQTHDGRTFHKDDTEEVEGRICHIDDPRPKGKRKDEADARQGHLEVT